MFIVHLAWRSRIRTATIALLLTLPFMASAAQSSRVSCNVIGNEVGFMNVHGYGIVYSASTDSGGFTLYGVVVVRAPADFLDRSAPDSQPPQWRANGKPGHLGGATVGPLWIGHEQSTNTIWIDSLAVPLDSNNVLLVEVDARGTPMVAGQAQIEARVPISPMACDEATTGRRHQEFADVLWDRFWRTPRVRVFLSR